MRVPDFRHPLEEVFGGETTSVGGWIGEVNGHYVYVSNHSYGVSYYVRAKGVEWHECETLLETIAVLEWIKAGGLDEENDRANTGTEDNVG